MDVNVTQITSTATAVTANGESGIITCFTSTLAGAASVVFTVNNTAVRGGANANGVLATIMDYSGAFTTNGLPIITIDNIVEDAFDVTISNGHASNALAGILKIAFLVI